MKIDDDHVVVFRYRDMPGMVGRVGTCFGQHGININSAAVGHVAEDGGHDGAGAAVMVLTTDAPAPQGVLDQILATEGFFEARSVTL